jgi:hypothetical protein
MCMMGLSGVSGGTSTGLTPESQILALRWVLATARQDRDVMKLVAAELSQQHPFTTAAELLPDGFLRWGIECAQLRAGIQR